MSQRPCNSYATATYDPARCKVCNNRFKDHIKSVRDAWWRSAPDVLIDLLNLRLKFLDQESPERCLRLNLICVGDDLKVCECGRLRTEHHLKVIVQSEAIRRAARPDATSTAIKATINPLSRVHPSYGLYTAANGQCTSYRKLEPGTAAYCRKLTDHTRKGDPIHEHEGPRVRLTWMNSTSSEIAEPFTIRRTAKSPCEDFSPVTELPGYCKFCGYSYIEHSETGRGLQLEDMTNMHSPGCACIQKLGLNRCSCMDDIVKQMMLDSLGEVRKRTAGGSGPVECLRFNSPEPQTSDLCSCGKRFHQHSGPAAREGFDTWARWRAAHMTNTDIVNWFIGLGSDNTSRMKAFKQHLEKPDNLSTTAPPPEVIRRISQMLPAQLHGLLKTPLKPSKRDNCFKCGSPLLMSEESICEDCQNQALGPDWVPRLKPPVGSKLATEHNANTNDWEGGHGYNDSKFD